MISRFGIQRLFLSLQDDLRRFSREAEKIIHDGFDDDVTWKDIAWLVSSYQGINALVDSVEVSLKRMEGEGPKTEFDKPTVPFRPLG